MCALTPASYRRGHPPCKCGAFSIHIRMGCIPPMMGEKVKSKPAYNDDYEGWMWRLEGDENAADRNAHLYHQTCLALPDLSSSSTWSRNRNCSCFLNGSVVFPQTFPYSRTPSTLMPEFTAPTWNGTHSGAHAGCRVRSYNSKFRSISSLSN